MIWIVSGDADSHLPVADVETVFDRVHDRATLVLLPGVAHVLLDEADPGALDAALGDFLDSVSRRWE